MYDPVEEYIEQVTTFICKQTGKDRDIVKKYIVDKLKQYPITNPEVTYLERDENLDKQVRVSTLRDYIYDSISNKYITVPSFTCYVNKDTEESFHVSFIDMNMKIRKKAKAKALECRVKEDRDGFSYWNTIQYAKKISNNSLSGAYVSSGTILNNPSAHYTLTSITRCVSGIGNAVTERMVGGHRHYRNPSIVLSDIAAILHTIDKNKFSNIIDKYSIHIPTIDETMECIKYSTIRYWSNSKYENYIRNIINKLDGVDRAMIVYINDLYHLKKYNDTLVRKILSEMVFIPDISNDYPVDKIYEYDEDYIILGHHILADELKGLGMDYNNIKKLGIYDKLVSVVDNIDKIYRKYSDFINNLFFNNHMPISTAYIQSMLREVTVLSDTDSTCATYQDWVKWYFGEIGYTQKYISISASVMMLNSKMISHYLDIFTSNIQASDKDIGVLKMKNEFYWDIMTPMNVTKHYYAAIRIQEGNVLRNYDLELKGVHMIGSKVFKEMSVISRKLITSIIDKIINKDTITMEWLLEYVINTEKYILKLLNENNTDIFVSIPIKDKDSYKQSPEESKYNYHILWQKVFERKYGELPLPPYTGIKIPVIIDNKTRLKNWIDNIDDPIIKEDASKYFNNYKMSGLKMLVLPKLYVQSYGIPNEIFSIIDKDRLVSELCTSLYLILESMGYTISKEHLNLYNQLCKINDI